jgi:hypothetical protein
VLLRRVGRFCRGGDAMLRFLSVARVANIVALLLALAYYWHWHWHSMAWHDMA